MPALDNLQELITLLVSNWNRIGYDEPEVFDGAYCPTCGANRRMGVTMLQPTTGISQNAVDGSLQQQIDFVRQSAPVLLEFSCVQCEGLATALIYRDQSDLGLSLAIFHERKGSFATPHTPDSVAYYLDQAYKCWSVGALSAAIAMYRVAVDQILFGAGYNKGMLGQKIGALEKDIEAGKASQWAKDLDTAYVKVLKDLGNAALHTNDGDISTQALFDRQLLAQVKATVQELLSVVYEHPFERKQRLKALQDAASGFNS